MNTIPLGTDAVTAHRLVMGPDRTAVIGDMLAVWTMLGFHEGGHRRQMSELPDGFRREQGVLILDADVEPIVLTLDEIYAESMRLAALQRAPDADGYLDLSNVARIGRALAKNRDLEAMGAANSGFTKAIKANPVFQTRNVGDVIGIRFKGGDIELSQERILLVGTGIQRPGDAEPRALETQTTFGEAQRAILKLDTTLAADGTRAILTRGETTRIATFTREDGWRTEDGARMRRISDDDPVRHAYANGRWVDGLVGFASTGRTGRITANVGVPYDSEGDSDAFVSVVDRREAASLEEAIEMLEGRGDVDHVFRGMQRGGPMGYWLTCLKD